jgi:mono/diheme cytochrome c family protein
MRLHGKRPLWVFPLSLSLVVVATAAMTAISGPPPRGPEGERSASSGRQPDGHDSGRRLVAEGLQTFRFDTFGDEAFWGGTLGLHEVVATLSPEQALGLGLKVDSEALPSHLKQELRRGKLDLGDPAVTLELLRRNAVVGVTGFFSNDGRRLESFGIQCALCHSVVDDSLAPGIGRRLDGWANRDLNVGAIVAAAPSVKPFADALGVDEATVRVVLESWGPGKFDAELILDGKAFRPDGKPAATLIPPAFGMAGVDLNTWTGWGTVTYWNAFVANLEMHGQGTFEDARLRNPAQFPIAAANGFFDVRSPVDRITPKLAGLHDYQLSLPAPTPPSGSFNKAAAERGRVLFDGKARCATCHVPPLFTEPGWNLHLPAEIGIDDFQANRSPTFRYRTAPLRGLWTHAKGGYYHDGRFASLEDVIDHYDGFFRLDLAPREVEDLVQYLKSL